MEITDIRVRLSKANNGKLLAVASITVDNAIAIHDIKIIGGNNGPFIAMPSRKTAEGEFKDIVHPINSEVRAIISEAVLKAYQEALDSSNE